METKIKEIQELSIKLTEKQAEIKASNDELEELQATIKNSNNSISEDEESIKTLQAALNVIASESAKKALEYEINNLKDSVKNNERILQLEKKRSKAIKEMRNLSEKLVKASSEYKLERVKFEKKFNKVLKDTLKFLENEPIEETAETDEDDELFLSDPVEKDSEFELKFHTNETSPQPVGSSDVIYEVFGEDDTEDEKDPLSTLVSVLRRFECVTGQIDAEEYVHTEFFKKMDISDTERDALEELMTTDKLEGLSTDQTKVIQGSVPASILKKLGRKDLILKRGNGSDIYLPENFKKDRKKFTYTVMAKLLDILQQDGEEKELKLETFFKSNSDSIEKRNFIKKPVYRTFIVLNPEDLTA